MPYDRQQRSTWTKIQTIGQHLILSIRLFLRHGALLTALWAGGAPMSQLLLRLAVELGILGRLLGLVAIAPVGLLQLVIFVSFFVILRDGQPRLLRRRGPPQAAAEAEDKAASGSADPLSTAEQKPATWRRKSRPL